MDEREAQERRELEAAGWEPKERDDGETVWRSPVGGLYYPQDVVVAMVREGADPDVPLEPGDEA